MKNLMGFLKTSLIGGLFVLLPLMLFYLLVAQMVDLVVALATPIADLFPKGTFDEVEAPLLIALILIVGASFLFGLTLRSSILRNLGTWVERTVLGQSNRRDAIERVIDVLLCGPRIPAAGRCLLNTTAATDYLLTPDF